MKKSQIRINIELDTDGVPAKINWEADNSPQNKEQECKAFLLSVFDKETKDTLKIDLWTKEMQVMEMDRFFYQTLRAMSDTYFKATSNKELATQMQQFVQFFGEKTEILPKGN